MQLVAGMQFIQFLEDGPIRWSKKVWTCSLAYRTEQQVYRSWSLILMITGEYPPQRRISTARQGHITPADMSQCLSLATAVFVQ